MIKVDKSLEEVWEMKERVYEDFLKSGYKSIIDFIKEDTKDFKINNNIRNRSQQKKGESSQVAFVYAAGSPAPKG